MPSFLESLNISGFDAGQYALAHFGNATNAPNIGLAFSGGGYRAMLTAAGALQAFDGREGGNDPSSIQGLLDSTTYLAGLSGGGWLVGSIYVWLNTTRIIGWLGSDILQINNFSTVSNLLNSGPGASNDLWNFSNPLFTGPDDSPVGVTEYFTTLHEEVEGKENAGFNTTFSDYWGQALAFQLVDAVDGGPSYTWSSIRNNYDFVQGKSPFPLLAADSRMTGQFVLSPTNTTVFEFNPFEMGTWDPTNYGFVDVQFIGSNFSNGTLPASEQCIEGFDNAGFTLGTTSSIFNSLVATALTSAIPASVQTILGSVINETRVDNGLIALYEPNPFKGWNITGQALDANNDALVLVDGGTDLQNIPFQAVIQPARDVDIVIAVDSSADTESMFPNGTAMVATYQRSLNASGIGNHTAFPSVPDQNTFVNLGLNQRPTFFGCNASNFSSPTPLVVYIPNAPYSYYSNISTFQLDINTTERNAIVANGHQVATMGNGTANKQFKSCLGCAILNRSFGRTNTSIPQACATCFEDFCWNGIVNSTTPAPYNPVLGFLGESTVNTTGSGSSGGSGSAGGAPNSASKVPEARFISVLIAIVVAMLI